MTLESTKKTGFTLIELLVVISIIGVLASVVLASLSEARIKARDSHRIAQMQQVVAALQLYYTDHGRYPGIDSPSLTYVENIVGLAPTYISTLPIDPYNIGTARYRYIPAADPTLGFTILIDLESDSVTWCRIKAGQPGYIPWETNYPLCN